MKEIDNMVIFGEHDENTINQIKEVSNNAVKVALLSDGHKGYYCPIGGIVAYRNQLLLNAVGNDIACGNIAIKTNRTLQDISQKKLTLPDITNIPELVRSDEYLISLIIFIFHDSRSGKSNVTNRSSRKI